MKETISKNPIMSLLVGLGLISILLIGLGKALVGSAQAEADYRPASQKAFMDKMEAYQKQYEESEYNEEKQNQIAKEAELYGAGITSVEGWISPVAQISNGNIKVVMMQLYPPNISSFSDLRNGDLVKYSGKFHVGSVTNMFGKWSVHPEVTYCQVERFKK